MRAFPMTARQAPRIWSVSSLAFWQTQGWSQNTPAERNSGPIPSTPGIQ